MRSDSAVLIVAEFELTQNTFFFLIFLLSIIIQMQPIPIKFETFSVDRYDEVIQLIADTYGQNNEYYSSGLFPVDELVQTTHFIRQVYESQKQKYPNRPLILALTQNSKIIASAFILDFTSYYQRIINSQSPWQQIYLSLDPSKHLSGKSIILFRLSVSKHRIKQGLATKLFQNVLRYLKQTDVRYTIAVQSSIGARKTFEKYNPSILKTITMSHKGQSLQSELIVIDNESVQTYAQAKL